MTGSRIKPGDMELGLGIHGEPGAETARQRPVDEIVATVGARVSCSATEAEDRRLALRRESRDSQTVLWSGFGDSSIRPLSFAQHSYSQKKNQLKGAKHTISCLHRAPPEQNQTMHEPVCH